VCVCVCVLISHVSNGPCFVVVMLMVAVVSDVEPSLHIGSSSSSNDTIHPPKAALPTAASANFSFTSLKHIARTPDLFVSFQPVHAGASFLTSELPSSAARFSCFLLSLLGLVVFSCNRLLWFVLVVSFTFG
jgi:hypothetical protein